MFFSLSLRLLGYMLALEPSIQLTVHSSNLFKFQFHHRRHSTLTTIKTLRGNPGPTIFTPFDTGIPPVVENELMLEVKLLLHFLGNI